MNEEFYKALDKALTRYFNRIVIPYLKAAHKRDQKIMKAFMGRGQTRSILGNNGSSGRRNEGSNFDPLLSK